jgi:FkbM family methyltransferase
MQVELAHEIQHSSLRDELNRVQSQLVHEIRHASLHENRTHAAGLHQAIQASREAILEELSWSNLQSRKHTSQELSAMTARLDRIERAIVGESPLANGERSQQLSGMIARLDRIEQYALASARRVAVHGEPGTVLLKSQVGYLLCSDSDHAVLAALLETGELEPGTRLLIERFLAPGDVFVDIGANLGLLSLAAARAMHGRGKIIAFEPFPETHKLMERSFWINGFSGMLELHEAAVFSASGKSTLFLGKTSGHHSMFALNGTGSEAPAAVDVELVTLDSVVPSDQSITLIKIDAEGAELDIIKGAATTLQRNPDAALIAEFGPSHLRRTNHTVDDWLGTFENLGYQFRRVNGETGALEEVTRDELLAADSTNLFFARPTAPAWKKLGVDL